MQLRRTQAAAVSTATLLLVLGCANEEGEPAEVQGQNSPAEETVEEDGAAGESSGEEFTMSDVEDNDSPESCWTVIDDRVYDVTDWVEEHPGGASRIEQLCGIDGTEMFSNQHSTDDFPQEQLASFQIGELAD